jgi:hypothetical protein
VDVPSSLDLGLDLDLSLPHATRFTPHRGNESMIMVAGQQKPNGN